MAAIPGRGQHHPVHAPDGSVSHYLGMHRDVTTLRQLECMVNNQKQLITSVLDAAPMVFALLDGNGGLMLSNHAYHSMARRLTTTIRRTR